MRLAIYWSDIMHYQAARLGALYHLGDAEGHEVVTFSLSSQSSELPITGYQEMLGHRERVLCQTPALARTTILFFKDATAAVAATG